MKEFQKRNTWIFDLDNTLYSGENALFSQVGENMTRYIMENLSLSEDDAREVRRDYFHRYGTTLRGLMTEHDISPDDYSCYVHEIDYGTLDLDELLREYLERLKMQGKRILIYTNGPKSHADTVLERLGLEGIFEDIFDIESGEWEPKPNSASVNMFMSKMSVDPNDSVMIDDLPSNLLSLGKEGMMTVWIRNEVHVKDLPPIEHGRLDSIDFATHRIHDFLGKVLEE